MSYDQNNHKGSDPEREDREALEREWERDEEAYDERVAAVDAGLCSRRAAFLGGAEYLRDLAETMVELKEAGCAIPRPVAAAPAGPKREAREEGRAA